MFSVSRGDGITLQNTETKIQPRVVLACVNYTHTHTHTHTHTDARTRTFKSRQLLARFSREITCFDFMRIGVGLLNTVENGRFKSNDLILGELCGQFLHFFFLFWCPCWLDECSLIFRSTERNGGKGEYFWCCRCASPSAM